MRARTHTHTLTHTHTPRHHSPHYVCQADPLALTLHPRPALSHLIDGGKVVPAPTEGVLEASLNSEKSGLGWQEGRRAGGRQPTAWREGKASQGG